MSDVFNAVEIDPANADKLLKHLEKIKESQADSPELGEAVNSAMVEFRKFFLSYGEPYFPGHELQLNQTPEARVYNENVEALVEDLSRLYSMVSSAAASSLTAYNYASVVSNEVKNAAEFSASKVLDLSILSDFVKGTTIVAGDDFINGDKIDSSFPVESTNAELINGSSSVGLKAVDIKVVSGPNVKISVTPVMPAGNGGNVNTEPTPQNLQRFYEGKFYAPIGQQKAEGGQLKMTYIADPSSLPGQISSTSTNGGEAEFSAIAEGLGEDPVDITEEQAMAINEGKIGFFAILPSTQEEKDKMRSYMVDGNPDTWWECEFVYQSEPLIDPFNFSSDDVIAEIGAAAADNEDTVNG